jgi:hypothetical protein
VVIRGNFADHVFGVRYHTRLIFVQNFQPIFGQLLPSVIVEANYIAHERGKEGYVFAMHPLLPVATLLST